MKRYLQLFLTFVFIIGYIYILYILEYWQQIKSVDNIIGAGPLFCFIILLIFCILFVWKSYKNSNIILFEIISILILASILSITGNWYITKDNNLPFLSPDLTVYEPFKEDTQTAQLFNKASLFLDNNLPTLDGATALYPVYTSFVNAVYNEEKYTQEIVVCTNTNNAYKRIIDGDVDIIFVAGASKLQQKEAEKQDINLVFTPIGKEAFVFLVAKSNPINNLSYQQIKNIYSGKTRYWKTLGRKNDNKMLVFRRPEGSGSETGLQKVMNRLPIFKPQIFLDKNLIGSNSMLKQVSVEWQGRQPAIGYSYRYYATTMYPNEDTKMLSINDVYPSIENIINNSYPFTADFYAVTRGEPQGNVKKLIDWILSNEGQDLIEKTGYVPLRVVIDN